MVVCVWACVSGLLFPRGETQIWLGICGSSGLVVLFLLCYEATRWLSWYGVGLASADRLPVVFEPLLAHSGVSSATRRKATGANPKKSCFWFVMICLHCRTFFGSLYKMFYCLCSCKDRARERHRPYSRKKNFHVVTSSTTQMLSIHPQPMSNVLYYHAKHKSILAVNLEKNQFKTIYPYCNLF